MCEPAVTAAFEHRPFLLYCAAHKGVHAGEFFSPHRLFDVALNDYSGEGTGIGDAEYQFAEKGHKWPCFSRNLEKIPRRYSCYAVFDADLIISTSALNTLFTTGYALNLHLFQAALSRDSHYSHPHLRQQRDGFVREVQFVENMMPVFSAAALALCWPAFDGSESGWGCDYVWAKLLNYEGLAVIDAVTARHPGRVTSGSWILSNGKTPHQELARALALNFQVFQEADCSNFSI